MPRCVDNCTQPRCVCIFVHVCVCVFVDVCADICTCVCVLIYVFRYRHPLTLMHPPTRILPPHPTQTAHIRLLIIHPHSLTCTPTQLEMSRVAKARDAIQTKLLLTETQKAELEQQHDALKAEVYGMCGIVCGGLCVCLNVHDNVGLYVRVLACACMCSTSRPQLSLSLSLTHTHTHTHTHRVAA